MAEYRIEEIAMLCGLTKRSIRYYEEIDLLRAPERSSGGYRIYTEEHLQRLQQIVAVRETLGFSLQQIQAFVNIKEEVELALATVRQSVDSEKLGTLQSLRGLLERQRQLIADQFQRVVKIKDETDELFLKVNQAIARYPKE